MSTLVSTTRSARAEFLRLRKWPTVWVTLSTWLLLNVLFGYLFPYVAYRTDSGGFSTEGESRASLLASILPAAAPDTFLGGTPMFGAALMMVLGALVAGSGYAWGTWKEDVPSSVELR